ncbi:MAG TPA: hypothetical protein ENO08_00455 [Candidatus Eisenbacteria bacterium]|uniref:Delta-aminolevulinic acid dehydratase n=1 Tax=Eiseniibacteriota bacterium TaxID=2212470 RepID=A0A7V2ATD6_UNCEI|nr:hypothetical protein [Candidatus Eisenbacteria bacterium]
MDISHLIERQYNALKERDFKGYDPYDGLSSRIFRKTPCFGSRRLRLAWIQLFKRSPVNPRSVALVPEGYNAKGLALVMRGLVCLYSITGVEAYRREARRLAQIIISQRAVDRSYFCVGYNFFWEAKAFSAPTFTPNMVVSSFAGQAFLDLYAVDDDTRWLDYARQVGEFIERELVLFESVDEAAFGYVPGEETMVHNVNLMGARLYARLYSLTGEERYGRLAVKAARYSAGAQRKDGAWAYGENPHHRWVDNFHTGFNLVSLREIDRYLPDRLWKRSMEKGLAYHLDHHFLDDMTPKYYDSRLYPIDIHNFAQGIDTMLAFGYEEKARMLAERCVETMWDERRNYFYYQRSRWYTNRIDYMRWSQAWMFYALARYRLETEGGEADGA